MTLCLKTSAVSEALQYLEAIKANLSFSETLPRNEEASHNK